MVDLVARQRYGIHALVNEPFGIAVAEMVRAGCIVFTHRSGGQEEILGGDDRLLYSSTQDAVEKIINIMDSPQETASVRTFLKKQGELFSTDRFVGEIRNAVSQFLNRRQTIDNNGRQS